jgi:polysaccharide biosynthesis protein PslH
MNILLLTDGVPYPPDSGPRVKTYQLLRHLANSHRLTLVCLAADDSAPARAAALRPLCDHLELVYAPQGRWHELGARLDRPATVARNASAALHDRVARLVADASAAGHPFDLVHVDQISMAQFAEPLPLPRLLDTHNALWKVYAGLAEQRQWPRSWAARSEARQLRAYEGRICASFEAVTAVSSEDGEALREAAGAIGRLSVIPIGVDGAALAPVPREQGARAVLSLAAPGWPPNAEGIGWFTREVFPLVHRAVPDSRLYICGADPTAEVRALSERQPGVEVTGFVDPRPYLERAAVLIAPLRSSGGMRVMLLEALARGIPVVATSLACADLDLVGGEQLLIADSPSAFADSVTLLLRDQELGGRIGAAGRQRALERYDWRALTPAIDHVYAQISARPALHPDEAAGQPVALL